MNSRTSIGAAVGLASLALCVRPVAASSLSTYVSGGGSDSGACTLAAPCRSFVYALKQTSPGGELLALDSATYESVANGALAIGKTITIAAAPGVDALIVMPSGGSVTINAGASDTITFKGITFDGQGVGANGILFNSGGTLQVIGCLIRGFVGSSTGGNGIRMQPNGTSANFVITNTTIVDNAYVGFFYSPNGGTVSGSGVIDHSTFTGNQYGIAVNNSATSGGAVNTTISNSVSANNGNGIYLYQSGSAKQTTTIDFDQINNNGSGLITFGNATVLLRRSVLAGNGYGVYDTNAAVTFTYGDNRISRNSTADVTNTMTPVSTK